jgi:hypothetical protein
VSSKDCAKHCFKNEWTLTIQTIWVKVNNLLYFSHFSFITDNAKALKLRPSNFLLLHRQTIVRQNFDILLIFQPITIQHRAMLSLVERFVEGWNFVVQGISSQSVKSNLALLRIKVLIFANIFDSTCSWDTDIYA